MRGVDLYNYVKTTEAACVSDELCCFKEDGPIVSLDDSRIERVLDRLASLSLLTVRVVALEYSQLHKKPIITIIICEFGGFENVLRDARHPYSTDVVTFTKLSRRRSEPYDRARLA